MSPAYDEIESKKIETELDDSIKEPKEESFVKTKTSFYNIY